MSLAGAECGKRPNSSAQSDGSGGGGWAWQGETVSHIERGPPIPSAGSGIAR